MLNPRSLAKRAIEAGAVRSGVARRRIAADPSGVAILAYHNVVPHGESAVGERSAHIPQERFGRHLDVLARSHDVVPLDQALLAPGDDRERPRAVVTFDDAYTGAVTAGFEELEKRGMPATMFVPPGLLGGEGFWWDRVGQDPGDSLDYGFRHFAVEDLEGRQEEVIRWAGEQNLLLRDLPEHARPTTASALVRMARSAGVALAPHTWSHPNLRALSDREAWKEIQESRRWVAEAEAAVVDWLAYPYGLWSDSVAEMVREEMSGAVLILGGLARKNGRWTGDRAVLPRIIVPSGLSADGLVLRLAGWIDS